MTGKSNSDRTGSNNSFGKSWLPDGLPDGLPDAYMGDLGRERLFSFLDIRNRSQKQAMVAGAIKGHLKAHYPGPYSALGLNDKLHWFYCFHYCRLQVVESYAKKSNQERLRGKSGALYPCFEFLALERFSKDIWNSEISDTEKDRLLEDPPFGIVCDQKLLEMFPDLRQYLARAYKVFEKLLPELAEFDSRNAEDQQKIADAVFSVASLCNNVQIVFEASNIAPSIKDFFGHIADKFEAQNAKTADDVSQDSAPDDIESVWKHSIDELQKISSQALSAPPSRSTLQRILDIASALDARKDEVSSDEAVYSADTALKFVTALVRSMQTSGIIFDDRLISQLMASWQLDYGLFSNREVQSDGKVDQAIESLTSLASDCCRIQDEISQLSEEKRRVEEQLSTEVSPGQARKLNTERRDIQKRVALLEDDRIDKHNGIWAAASPPGRDIDLDADYLEELQDSLSESDPSACQKLTELIASSSAHGIALGATVAGSIPTDHSDSREESAKVESEGTATGSTEIAELGDEKPTISAEMNDAEDSQENGSNSASESASRDSHAIEAKSDLESESEVSYDEFEEEQQSDSSPDYATILSSPANIARAYLGDSKGQFDRHPVHQSNLLWAMVDRGYTLVAYWFLKSLESCGAAEPALPSASLFKAAALAPYVSNIHGPAANMHSQAILEIDTDKHLSLLSSDFGRSLACLSIAATFQPSLFRPDSISLQILRYSAGKFDPEFSKLLLDIAKSAERGEILSLADFDTSQASQDYSAALGAIQETVASIRSHAMNKRTGYYWANIILKDVLTESELAPICRAVRKNASKSTDLELVAEIVAQYGTRRSLLRLLEDKRHQLQGNIKRSEKIVGDARNHFVGQCQDLIEQGALWLELNQRNGNGVELASSDSAKSKIERMRTILPKVIGNIERELSSVERLDEHAGLVTLVEALQNVDSLLSVRDAKSFKGIDADAWINLPNAMMGSPEHSDDSPRLADELAVFAETNFNYDKWCRTALESGNVRLAAEVCDEIGRTGSQSESDLLELRRLISDENDRQNEETQHRSRTLDRRIEEAFNAGLLPQSDYVEYKFEVEVVQNDLGASSDEYPDYPRDHASLEEIEARIGDVTEEHLESIKRDWKVLRETAKRNKRLDDLPEGWEAGLIEAIESGDVTVAEEYIQQFRDFIENNAELFDYRNKGLSGLTQFLECAPAIEKYIKSHGIRETAKTVRAGGKVGDIDFDKIREKPTSVLQSLESLRSTTRKTLAEGDLTKLADILKFHGFQWPSNAVTKGLESAHSGKMLVTKIPLSSGADDSPLPSFGSKHGKMYPVVLVWKYRNLEEVAQFLQDNDCQNGAILLFLEPLDLDERKRFATISHKERLTILCIDPVELVFLSFYRSVARRETVLRSVFKICLPFTYDNPYVDALYPPPQEMVFGRRKEIDRLLRPNGVAIIYGGRQLGKSTILKEAESRLHKPNESSYAFYFSADSDIGKGLPYETLTTQFWNKIISKLESSKLINAARLKSPDVSSNVLRELMAKNQSLRITLLVDEADELLNIDSLHGFSLFRSFREHFYDSGNRFRVIIAGLQNVQRFSNMPNNPLNQLGGSQPVTILPSVDGIRLIRDPLAVLGYSFADMTTVNRILAYTNNHPGLIQLFCHYLLEYLTLQVANDRIVMPGYEITERDIEQTYQSKAIREGIVDRFNLTLRLDPRYRVLVYGFILENIKLNYFNVKEAKDIGERYWPEEFRSMSTTKLRAILEEMVGLGVLIHETGDFNEDLYRFRNTNVFQLLGGDEIKRETIKEITEHVNDDDPTLHHRLIKLPSSKGVDLQLYSPLSLGDELNLLGKLDARRPDDVSNTGGSIDSETAEVKIACIYGSTANGLEHVRQTLPWLSTLNDPISQQPYKLIAVREDKLRSIVSVNRYVVRALEISADVPVILTLDMPSFSEDSSLYVEYLEFLYAIRRKHPKNSVWIILLFSPAATWYWLENRNAEDIEADGIHIHLERWRNPALDRVLKDRNMLDGRKQIDFLREKTGGWYGFVKLFSDKALESDKTDDPEKLSRFIELISSRFKSARKAGHGLSDIGVNDVGHIHDLLDEIVKNEYHRELQLDTLRLFAEEFEEWGFQDQEERILEWFLRMGILRAIDTVDGTDHDESTMRFEIEPITYHLLIAARENAA